MLAVALGVHAGPEAAMAVNVELAVFGEFDEGLALEDAIFFFREILEEVAMEKEKAAVDPVVFDVGFFREAEHMVVLDFDFSETGRRIDAENSAEFRAGAMVFEFGGEIGVGDAITVSDAKEFGVAEILTGRLGDTTASHAGETSVSESDLPIEVMCRFVDDDLVGLELHGAVAVMEMKMAEVIDDVFRFKTEAEDEAFEAMAGVNLHHMPENGVLADGHHGLGAEFGLFFEARSQATAKDENRDLIGSNRVCHESNSEGVKTTNGRESTGIRQETDAE